MHWRKLGQIYSADTDRHPKLATHAANPLPVRIEGDRAEDLDIGENCFILDNQSISLDVKIGNNVMMWSSNHIGDLTRIGDHAWLASHATIAGEVVVQPYCFIGIGATVGNKVTLGQGTFVGANALVASDTAENSVCLAGGPEGAGIDSPTFMRVMMAKGKL